MATMREMKRVSVFMDVEDPVNPLADDAALDLASLFSEVGVRGSFCVTGEKCRCLVARGRWDVLEALGSHAVGVHTDTHSYHPTTMELLEKVSFAEGCTLAYDAEKRGVEAFESGFRRRPTFWGGAGNTWSPEVSDALSRLGIGAHSYALTEVPGQGVHRFNGVVALPQALSVSEQQWRESSADEMLERIQEISQPWVGLFVGHPTRFRYEAFWDWPYAGGQTPASPSETAPSSTGDYERSKRNLAMFLQRLGERAQIIGVDEALELPWRYREPTSDELEYFESRTAINLRGAAKWPIHRPDLDPENIVRKTLDLGGTLEIAYMN